MRYVVVWTRPDLGTVFHSFHDKLERAKDAADGVATVARLKGQRKVKVLILETKRVK